MVAVASRKLMFVLSFLTASVMDLYSTVPTAAPASMGVKRKKLRGETTVTSYFSVVSRVFRYDAAPQPVPRTTTFSFFPDWVRGGEGIEGVDEEAEEMWGDENLFFSDSVNSSITSAAFSRRNKG